MNPRCPRLAAICRSRSGRFLRAPLIALVAALACTGCQSILPTALPTSFALREDAKIAKQAKADGFPSPSDVGLTAPTAVP